MSSGPGTKTGLSAADTMISNPRTDDQFHEHRFTAMQGSVLNVKTYHRGIEGDESRDQQTGELRFPTKASDTNHDADGPRSLGAMITIHFPLTDMQSTGYDESSFYRQTIKWDLGNPSTPTPMMFAASLGSEYGLSYPDILNVAASIQKQLQTFCMEKCSSAVPTLVKSGNVPKPIPTMCNLYGDVLGFGSIGGSEFAVPRKPILSTSQRSSTSSVASKTIAKTKVEKNPAKTKPAPTSSERTPVSIEKAFYRQALLHLKRESDDYIRTHWAHDNTGEMGVRDAGPARCHLCQRHYDKCVLYPCGILGHTVCENHMLEKHGISLQSGSQSMSDCPLCTLRCSCSLCSCKLGLLATRLKTLCGEHGGKPSTTAFHGIHAQCVAITPKDCREYLRSNGATGNFVLRPQVPKTAPVEFPREVIDGIDIDFEYQEHYDFVFTSSGGKKIDKATKETTTSDAESSTAEQPNSVVTGIDGNTDFCMVCNKVGNLVCCDVCPRAYHVECLTNDTAASVEGNLWECPSCRSERDGPQGDLIDGSTQIEPIKAAYVGNDSNVNDSNLLNTLSIIVEMVEFLMQYDFGYMFRTPVDTKQVPDYSVVIKAPMDLGTISSRICTGKYKESLGDAYSLDGVVLAALKDVELVWHNCLLFNIEGSAVYRMAGVLSRRAAAIRLKSFETLLPNQVKTELATFVDALASERAEARRTEPRQAASTPKNRHKVANIAKGGPQRRRPIVALDPDTCMVTKLYSTMLSFSSAVNIMVSRGLMFEYNGSEIDNANRLRTFVSKSAGDPSIRLFGYRWLYLDDLYDKKVSFQADMYASKDNSEDDYVHQPSDVQRWTIVVEDAYGKAYFRDVEEALSVINTQTDNDIESLNRKLKGREKLTLSDGVSVYAIDGDASSREPAILKLDVVASGRTLTGFCSVASAFADWRNTLESSVFEYRGAISIDVFQNFFLDKDRNIDGIKYFSLFRDESTDLAVSAILPMANAETSVSGDSSSKKPVAEAIPANPLASVPCDDDSTKLSTVEPLPVAIVKAPAVGVQSPDPSNNLQQENQITATRSRAPSPATSGDATVTNISEDIGQNIKFANDTQRCIKQNGPNGKNPTTTLLALVQKHDSSDTIRKFAQPNITNGHSAAGETELMPNVVQGLPTPVVDPPS
jgi:Bromodomain